MLRLKEIIVLLSASLVLGYVFQFPAFTWNEWMISSSLALLLLTINAIGYKLSARFFDSEAEIHHLTLKRYGFHVGHYFNRPIPIWAFFPLGLLFLTWGFVKWFAVTTFEVSPLALRGRRTFSNVSEWDVGLIAIGGLFFNLLLALIARFYGYDEFAKFNLYFVLTNLIPFSNMPGNKILFGSKYLWVLVAVFALAMLVLFEIVGIIGTIAISILLAFGGVALAYYLLEM